ncbi:tripartite tricarboxylate transporter TctB family protein [Oceanibium sediminis]|uniref:tripartite tricarboxylate transporter TctB family protein n=1 Tax=Oceanibium sediminis TaxID=2026339 RepID=UPI0013006EDD|nr:tripartite tricarboxylate transporter TctB family protein [Oceanibium sediminis]
MRLSRDFIFAFGALVIAAVFWVESLSPRYESDLFAGFGLNALQFPRVLLGIWTGLALLLLLQSVVKTACDAATPIDWRPAIYGMCGAFGYFFAMIYAGFFVASVIFMFVMPAVLGYRKYRLLAVLSPVITAGVWVVFVHLLQIQLPRMSWSPFF